MKEEHRNMHKKLLLNMYQASSEPKQEREKWKQEEEKKPNCRSDKCGKKEPTYTCKGNQENKFQNNYEVLVSVPPAEID
jgi:hypothetical protein